MYGGMISRYYIDRIMTDVGFGRILIILGTRWLVRLRKFGLPRLGFSASNDWRFNLVYMWEFLNRQIFIATVFHSMPLQHKVNDSVQSPCTPVPSGYCCDG